MGPPTDHFLPLFLLLLFGLFALSWPVVTLLHELGHAVAARLAGAVAVEMYVGSYGEQAGAWRVALPGQITLWFKLGLWPLRGGLCDLRWNPARLPGVGRQVAVLLAGPLASIALAVPLLGAAFGLSLHGALKLVAVVFGVLAALDLLLNLLPLRLRLPAAGARGGEVAYSDGYQLGRLLRRAWFPRRAPADPYLADYRAAAALYTAGDYAASAPRFHKLLPRSPNNEVYKLAFTAYYHGQQFAQALALADEYPALAAALEHHQATRAYLLARTEQLGPALALFDELLAAEPAPPTFLQNNRGYTLLLLGRFAEARRDFEAVIEHEPANAYAHAQRGRARLALGDAAGLADLHRALALDPNEPFAHCNLGLHAHAAGSYAEALAHLEHAATLDPHLHRLADYLAATRAGLAGAKAR